MTVAIQRLTGDALLAHIEEWKHLTKTEQCLTAGYITDKGKPAYVDFYTEIMNATPIVSGNNKDAADDAEYDELDDDKRALYDEVHDRFGEKWDHEEIMEFIDELSDIGIDDVSQLEDAYVYTHDEWVSTAEREFAEYWVCEVMCEAPADVIAAAVDWQAVWDHNLRYDFNTIEFDGAVFFFFNR
jgi:hypothetical protein